MIKWTGLAPRKFEFPFPEILTSTFLARHYKPLLRYGNMLHMVGGISVGRLDRLWWLGFVVLVQLKSSPGGILWARRPQGQFIEMILDADSFLVISRRLIRHPLKWTMLD